MKYVMKKNFWSWRNQLYIYDEFEQPVYEVRGKFLSFTDQISLVDMQAEVKAEIHKRLGTWTSCFDIHRGEEPFAEMMQHISWFKQRFSIVTPEMSYAVQGSLWDYHYSIECDGTPVAEIASPWWVWEHGYVIETTEGADDVLILCACLIIDRIKNQRNRAIETPVDV